MTSLSCGVDALLRAAQFLEEQEVGQLYRPIVLQETPQPSTGRSGFDFIRLTSFGSKNRYIICNVQPKKDELKNTLRRLDVYTWKIVPSL